MLVNPCCTEERGAHGREEAYWRRRGDAHVHVDMSVTLRLQVVVLFRVCQCNLRRLDGHRRPAHEDPFDFDQRP